MQLNGGVPLIEFYAQEDKFVEKVCRWEFPILEHERLHECYQMMHFSLLLCCIVVKSNITKSGNEHLPFGSVVPFFIKLKHVQTDTFSFPINQI